MADDREPLGRLVRETWIACVLDYFEDPKDSWVASYDETDDFQREVDMRIGSAIAARAVADAGLRHDRMEAQLFALGAHRAAIFDALRIAITASGYEYERKRYRAALKALGGEEESGHA